MLGLRKQVFIYREINNSVDLFLTLPIMGREGWGGYGVDLIPIGIASIVPFKLFKYNLLLFDCKKHRDWFYVFVKNLNIIIISSCSYSYY